ncbi:MAG: pilus assembly protein [Roseitalea sp.]|nr:pilus assembly protein [Roseitalea sp.]MBO6722909.1 pilus assembly protein [Roseitalea sp.]MBO6745057.1 pilus assembly protein [Roseitalea sp.]
MARSAQTLGWLRRAGGLARDSRGATAIEFGILALPFFLLAVAVLETTVSFTAEQVMSNTTDKLARQIRTGQIIPATTDENTFRGLICSEMEMMVPAGCPDLHFDLQSYSSFADVPKSIPFSAPGVIDTTGFRYEPGGAGTINNLRIIYKWPVYTDMMKSRIAGLQDGRMLLYTTTTWQNEQY